VAVTAIKTKLRDDDTRRPPCARGTGRGYRSSHCAQCGLRTPLCLCAQLPHVETTTRVWFVMHWRESSKPSNTARLAMRLLSNSTCIERGRTLDSAGVVERTLEPLDPASCLLLYPSDDALPLDEVLSGERAAALNLIVPDGTWGQTRRWVRRETWLAPVRRVRLSRASHLPGYRLRHAAGPNLYSTFEATAIALSVIHGWALGDTLLTHFEQWQQRALASRSGGLACG